jgi:hypothetical protein
MAEKAKRYWLKAKVFSTFGIPTGQGRKVSKPKIAPFTPNYFFGLDFA